MPHRLWAMQDLLKRENVATSEGSLSKNPFPVNSTGTYQILMEGAVQAVSKIVFMEKKLAQSIRGRELLLCVQI